MNKHKLIHILALIGAIIFFIFASIAPVVKAAPQVSKTQATEIQMILVKHGYVLDIDGIFGPKTEKAIRHWQKANGLLSDGIPGPITMRSLRESIDGPAEGPVAPAKRLNPPSPVGLNNLPFAPEGVSGCEEMSFYRVQWGLPDIFEHLGYRESNCRNDVTSRTGCCVGYWQNYISSHLSRASAYRERIINECQVNERADLLGNAPIQKQRQACVTKVVYDISGLSPWSL